jgi:hypothetical protein
MSDDPPCGPVDPLILLEKLRREQFPHLESVLVRRVLLLHLRGMQRDRDLDRAIDHALGDPAGDNQTSRR